MGCPEQLPIGPLPSRKHAAMEAANTEGTAWASSGRRHPLSMASSAAIKTAAGLPVGPAGPSSRSPGCHISAGGPDRWGSCPQPGPADPAWAERPACSDAQAGAGGEGRRLAGYPGAGTCMALLHRSSASARHDSTATNLTSLPAPFPHPLTPLPPPPLLQLFRADSPPRLTPGSGWS
jgi:hypothetical protein